MPLLPLLFGIIGLYVIIRVVLPSGIAWPLKLVAGAFLFVCAEKLYLTRLYYGSMSAYAMSAPVAIIAGALNVFVIMLFLLALLRDAWHLFQFVPFGIRSKKTGQLHLAVAAALLTIFSVWSALKIPAVHEVPLSVPNLPPSLAGLRVVQLSDLHIGPIFGERWLSGVVQKTNDLNPDLVVITGDLVDGYPADREKDMMPLTQIQARHGVYVVLGNHEYYSSAAQWIHFLRRIGLTVLLNEHVTLNIATDSGEPAVPLVVAGVTDPAATRMGLEAPNAEKALKGTTGTRLLLAHNPAIARSGEQAGADVQLSGHTHGGQLAFFAPVVAQFNEGYVSGTYTQGEMQIHVSRGTGLWSGMPLRLFCPSEITLLELQPEFTKK